MKKLTIIICAVLLSLQAFAAAPKYVFLFIGDGMGTNQVLLTQTYLSTLKGEYGAEPLCFTQFPVVGMATTYCLTSLVTDSAAAGTALATGVKTNVGKMGTAPDESVLRNIAEMAKDKGAKVAIMSTVGVNHATPAAFYAHRKHRGMYEDIFSDLAASDFDFFAGSEILTNGKGHNKQKIDSMVALTIDNGFSYVTSRDEFKLACKDASKVLMIPDKEHAVVSGMQYFLKDEAKKAQSVTLRDMLECSVEFMMKDRCKNGFFVMAEGGRIDGCGHGNDARKLVDEVRALDDAVAFAYEFYLKHPKETLIIVTADHETGGLTVTGKEPENFSKIQYQIKDKGEVTNMLKALMKSQEEVVSWEQVKALLSDNLGLWSKVELDASDEKIIYDEYLATVAKRETGHDIDPYAYADNAKIVSVAVSVLDRLTCARWTTTDHTAGYVPVYAVGQGCDVFSGLNDNTDIPVKISKLANYK